VALPFQKMRRARPAEVPWSRRHAAQITGIVCGGVVLLATVGWVCTSAPNWGGGG
jgi:hypothetical protein